MEREFGKNESQERRICQAETKINSGKYEEKKIDSVNYYLKIYLLFLVIV